MTFNFGKRERLKSKKLIGQLFKEGQSVTVYPLKLFYMRVADDQESKVKTAVSVPKKNFKSAVQRNRIKRLMREGYRLNKHLIFNNIEGKFAFLILYLGKELPEYRDVEGPLKSIFKKLVKVKK